MGDCLCVTIFTVVGDDSEYDGCKVVGNVVVQVVDMKLSFIDSTKHTTKHTIFNLYT